jgi:two-component sensor histidine kinase
MKEDSLSTCYASPHRSGSESLDTQRQQLLADENLCGLLDAMPEIVMILNENRQILFGNRVLTSFAETQGCTTYVGLRPGELLSCRSALAAEAGCGTTEACRYCGAVEAILAALKGHKSSHECRVLRQTPTGPEALDLKIWGTPLHWQGEQFILVVAVDISHEKRRLVLEHLFFHDILNTAGTITLITEMLMSGQISFDDIKHDLMQTAQALVGEIRGQRELMAAEGGELRVRMGMLDVSELLDAVATVHRNSEQATGRSVGVVDETAGLHFCSDGALLTRVLGNLLKNALEASLPDGKVTIGCRRSGVEIVFWCHNEGEIPEDVRLQIFQRSFSTKGSGRGIGTYSVKLFTEKYLQGHVSFTSSAREGTTFTLSFPLNPALP